MESTLRRMLCLASASASASYALQSSSAASIAFIFLAALLKQTQATAVVKKKDHNEEPWTDPFNYPNGTRKSPPTDYIDGPMPTISDSLFSLIILIYVGVIFVVMFFAFCWKEPEPPPPNPAHKNIPMITSMLEEMEKQEMAAKAAEVASEAEEAAQAASSEALIGMQPELTNGNTTGNGTTTIQEATEMKELSSNDKVNVISEKKELNNVGNSEAATSV